MYIFSVLLSIIIYHRKICRQCVSAFAAAASIKEVENWIVFPLFSAIIFFKLAANKKYRKIIIFRWNEAKRKKISFRFDGSESIKGVILKAAATQSYRWRRNFKAETLKRFHAMHVVAPTFFFLSLFYYNSTFRSNEEKKIAKSKPP